MATTAHFLPSGPTANTAQTGRGSFKGEELNLADMTAQELHQLRCRLGTQKLAIRKVAAAWGGFLPVDVTDRLRPLNALLDAIGREEERRVKAEGEQRRTNGIHRVIGRRTA